jgi:hypothetical protein
MGDDGDDVRWLSYTELAAVRGISRDLAARLVQSRAWQRRIDSDGTVRAAVPMTVLEPVGGQAARLTPDVRAGTRGHDERMIKALEDHLASLRDQLGRAQARLQALHDEREMRMQAEGERTVLKQVIDVLQTRLDAAEAEAAGAVETLRLVKRKGFWRRMLGR